MHQIPLDIQTAPHAVFENYLPGRNALATATVRSMAEGSGPPLVWLHGTPGVGRSHLLQAAVAATHARGAGSAYLPLRTLQPCFPAMLDGFGALDLVAIDDLEYLAGSADWEQALFRLFEQLLPGGGRLLIAAARPPAACGIALPDLRSRFASGAVFALEPLADEEACAALQLRAAWRGFALPAEVTRFLMTRVNRDPESLFGWLDRVDQASLAAQKRITVPFVRSILEGSGRNP